MLGEVPYTYHTQPEAPYGRRVLVSEPSYKWRIKEEKQNQGATWQGFNQNDDFHPPIFRFLLNKFSF